MKTLLVSNVPVPPNAGTGDEYQCIWMPYGAGRGCSRSWEIPPAFRWWGARAFQQTSVGEEGPTELR